MMKPFLIIVVIAILSSSCLKESIPDAMLSSQNAGGQGGAATLAYKVNGNAVNISVSNAANQAPNYYRWLGCTKSTGYYNLDAVSNSGEFTFTFYTDSLKLVNYKYTGIYGDMFFVTYNGQDEYVHSPTDSMSLNITSYKSGLISGNFSGRLTPLISAGNSNNTFGSAGSVLITEGSFQNVPVFY